MKDQNELRAKEYGLRDALDEAGDENPILRGKIDAIFFLRGEGDPITEKELPVPQTDDDLDKLIQQLRQEREKVPEYSMFGDPNWEITDAQIEICEWAKG